MSDDNVQHMAVFCGCPCPCPTYIPSFSNSSLLTMSCMHVNFCEFSRPTGILTIKSRANSLQRGHQTELFTLKMPLSLRNEESRKNGQKLILTLNEQGRKPSERGQKWTVYFSMLDPEQARKYLLHKKILVHRIV